MTTALVAAAAAGLVYAPFAAADVAEPAAPSTQALGSQAKLVNGDVIQGWTISNLKPSSDAIPYQPVGTLWEATATDTALQGSVTPIVSNLNARAADGQTYRALFGVATPQGVNPSTLAQGQETSGKVYFDVTGSTPNSVVYNAGGQDLAVWTPAAASSGSGSGHRAYTSTPSGTGAAAPASMPTTAAPEGTTAAPTATGAEALPAGSQGTPLPEGAQGTPAPAAAPGAPVPAGSQGTPLAPGQAVPATAAPAAAPAEGAPMPAANQPAGSQGTPLPQQAPQTPTTYAPTP
jgi:hypothetical protein